MVKLIDGAPMQMGFTMDLVSSLTCGAELAQDHSGASVVSSLLPGHLQPHPAVPHCLCHYWFTCVRRHPAE